MSLTAPASQALPKTPEKSNGEGNANIENVSTGEPITKIALPSAPEKKAGNQRDSEEEKEAVRRQQEIESQLKIKAERQVRENRKTAARDLASSRNSLRPQILSECIEILKHQFTKSGIRFRYSSNREMLATFSKAAFWGLLLGLGEQPLLKLVVHPGSGKISIQCFDERSKQIVKKCLPELNEKSKGFEVYLEEGHQSQSL